MTIPKRPRIFGRTVLALSAFLAVTAVSLSASTIAYWRFEEGPAGSPVPASSTGNDPAFADTVIDSSGSGNHLRTWTTDVAPNYISDTPFGAVPQTGQTNNLALDFMSTNRDLYTDGKDINSHLFTEWTMEATFRANVVDSYQVIVGKDGHPLLPGESPGGALHASPPVFFKTLAHNSRLEVGLVDGSRDFRAVETIDALQTGQWYSVAATATATEMSLWLKGPGDSSYVLQGTTAIGGAFLSPGDFNDPAGYDRTWSVGRGMWGGGLNDWFNGDIDEVRISDAALDPSLFLAEVPEPSTYALLGGLGALALVLLRRKRR